MAILAPAGCDGPVASKVLATAGFRAQVCGDIDALCEALEAEVGVLLVAEEALSGAGRERLLAALENQPAWSDVPVLLLTGEGELSRPLSPTLKAIAARSNATLIERPVRVATLVSALRSAIRARQRQFDVRDHLIERTVAEAALRTARQEAVDANRSKSEFLAVMSHELRTPLNAIGGYVQLMELGLQGPVTEPQREVLERIQKNQRHLLGLINQVLNYTRVEIGSVEYVITDVSLAEAFADAEALIAPQVHSKGLRCSVEECGAELRVRADGDKLRQILINLLANAIKFTARGWIRLACLEEGDTVVIRVTDTGIGIAADKIENIFEPFVQVDSQLTRVHEGVGLGLAISRDLARGMGGELTVESTLDVGSTFAVRLCRSSRTAAKHPG